MDGCVLFECMSWLNTIYLQVVTESDNLSRYLVTHVNCRVNFEDESVMQPVGGGTTKVRQILSFRLFTTQT